MTVISACAGSVVLSAILVVIKKMRRKVGR